MPRCHRHCDRLPLSTGAFQECPNPPAVVGFQLGLFAARGHEAAVGRSVATAGEGAPHTHGWTSCRALADGQPLGCPQCCTGTRAPVHRHQGQ